MIYFLIYLLISLLFFLRFLYFNNYYIKIWSPLINNRFTFFTYLILFLIPIINAYILSFLDNEYNNEKEKRKTKEEKEKEKKLNKKEDLAREEKDKKFLEIFFKNI